MVADRDLDIALIKNEIEEEKRMLEEYERYAAIARDNIRRMEKRLRELEMYD